MKPITQIKPTPEQALIKEYTERKDANTDKFMEVVLDAAIKSLRNGNSAQKAANFVTGAERIWKESFPPMVRTYRNKNFTKRDYDCTNIVFCQGEKAPNENWVECTASEIETRGCQPLHTQAGVQYFGWM